MRLYLEGHDYRYAAEQMMLTLFPGQRPEYPAEGPDGTDNAAWLTLAVEGGEVVARAELWWNGAHTAGVRRAPVSELTGGLEDDRVRQRVLRLAFYDAGWPRWATNRHGAR